MKKKIILAGTIILALLCGTVLLARVSPRRLTLAMQDETDGTTTELRIEGWTWNSLSYDSGSHTFACSPQIKGTVTIAPYPDAQTDAPWTADLLAINAYSFYQPDTISLIYMGYDAVNGWHDGIIRIKEEEDTLYCLWLEPTSSEDDDFTTTIFEFQTTALKNVYRITS